MRRGEAPPVEEIVVVQYENVDVGLVTDNVVGEYQAVLKPLGKFFKNQEIISGATILGDGSIALVLDTNKIINSFQIKPK
jgi:two-component system, chemotaxis family, sensor kinase CheA